MLSKNEFSHTIRIIITALLATFLFIVHLNFLGMLLVTALISDAILLFVKKNPIYQKNISSIGHYSYLASLAYSLIIILLYQSGAFTAQSAIIILFFGLILLFPLISLLRLIKK
ncbi:hypothetical protein A9P44_16335 [Paenibacillus polymyxa]|nr:hypothetical protein A9P44_16335 [Paenibacillus polymyxa]